MESSPAGWDAWGRQFQPFESSSGIPCGKMTVRAAAFERVPQPANSLAETQQQKDLRLKGRRASIVVNPADEPNIH